MVILFKLLTKYVITIYALGSVHEKFSVWIKAIPKLLQRRNSQPGYAKRMAEPFQIETAGIPNWFRCRTFHVLNSTYYVRLMKSSASDSALLSLKKPCFTTYHLLLLCKASCEALVNSTTRSSVANTYWDPANGYMPIKQMSRDDGGHRCRKNYKTDELNQKNPPAKPS